MAVLAAQNNAVTAVVAAAVWIVFGLYCCFAAAVAVAVLAASSAANHINDTHASTLQNALRHSAKLFCVKQ